MSWMGVNLHCSPIIRQEGNSISKIPVIGGPHTVSIVLTFVTSSNIITCDVLKVPKHWHLFNNKVILLGMSNQIFILAFELIFFIIEVDLLLVKFYLTTKLIGHEEVQHDNLQKVE